MEGSHGERKRNFVGQNLWARRFFVAMAGREEVVSRVYIRGQEVEDARLD